MAQPMTIEQVAERARRRIMAAHDRTEVERAAAALAAAGGPALLTGTHYTAAARASDELTADVEAWLKGRSTR